MQNKLNIKKGDLVAFRNNTAFGIVQLIEDTFGTGELSAHIRIAADKAKNSDPVKVVMLDGVEPIVRGYEKEPKQTPSTEA